MKVIEVKSSKILCQKCDHRWMVDGYARETKQGWVWWVMAEGTVQVCSKCGDGKGLKVIQLNWE